MSAGIAFCFRRVVGFEVDDDWFLRITDDDPLRGRVRGRVDFLMRHKWGNVDEVSRLDFLLELHVVAPAHLARARNDIDDGFDLAVVVYAAGGIGRDNCYAAPDAF